MKRGVALFGYRLIKVRDSLVILCYVLDSVLIIYVRLLSKLYWFSLEENNEEWIFLYQRESACRRRIFAKNRAKRISSYGRRNYLATGSQDSYSGMMIFSKGGNFFVPEESFVARRFSREEFYFKTGGSFF